uniref:hypothetical protein n=1 Tax=Mariniflexile sp. TaxID=1979402 RepID=UPI004047B1B6
MDYKYDADGNAWYGQGPNDVIRPRRWIAGAMGALPFAGSYLSTAYQNWRNRPASVNRIAPTFRRKVKKIINAGKMLKFKPTNFTEDTAVSSSGYKAEIGDISLDVENDDDFYHRTGRRVKLQKIHVAFTFHQYDLHNTYRWMILRCAKAFDPLTQLPGNWRTKDTYEREVNEIDPTARLKVLYDSKLKLCNEQVSNQGLWKMNQKTINFKTKKAPTGVTYEFDDNTDDPEKFKYYFMIVSDSTQAEHPWINGRVDMYFKDLD